MITLAIETSSSRGSVAVLENEQLLFNESFSTERTHSAQLFLALERALLAQPAPTQIAVGLGPGSYSGVRIAISAAIGLSLSTGARLVGLPSVLALETEAECYRVIGDARRGAFYFAEISRRECVEFPQLLTREELAMKLVDEQCPVFSSAVLQEFPLAQIVFPTAENLARLAARNLGIVARDSLEPLYLREAHITAPRIPPLR